ncbi:MAG: hypothetical protein GYA17_18680 [Chloroflexi bacterium]|nr:hypothetical protein [Chloroflexota bacterium]
MSPKEVHIRPLPLAALLAAATAPGIVLAAAGFRLSSGARLGVQAGLLAALLLLPLYLLLRRRSLGAAFQFSIQPLSTLLAGAAALLAGLALAQPGQSLARLGITAALLGLALFSAGGLLAGLSTPGRVRALALGVFLLLGAAGLGLLYYAGIFVRTYGDDFCFTVLRSHLGYWQSVWFFYQTWSGRVFYNLVLFAFASAHLAPLVQLVTMTLCTVALARAIRPGRTAGDWLAAAAAGLCLPFILLAILPDLYKTVYWTSASLNLLPVLAALPLHLGLAWVASRRTNAAWPLAAAGFLVCLMASSTHEVAAPPVLLLNVALLAAVYFAPPPRPGRALPAYLWAALAGSALGLAAALLSPGNYARQAAQLYPAPPGLLAMVELVWVYFMEYARATLAPHWALLLSALALGALLRPPLAVRRWPVALAALLVTLGLTLACFAPGVYATSSNLPLRTQAIPTGILVYGLFLSGVGLPRLADGPPARYALLLILAVFAQAGVWQVQRDARVASQMAAYARQWDQRDRLLREEATSPYPIDIPWDEVEQEFSCLVEYYTTPTVKK